MEVRVIMRGEEMIEDNNEVMPVEEEMDATEVRRRVERWCGECGMRGFYRAVHSEWVRKIRGPAIETAHETIELGIEHCRVLRQISYNGQDIVIACARYNVHSYSPFRCQSLVCNRPEVEVAKVGSYVMLPKRSVFSNDENRASQVFHGIHHMNPIELTNRMIANWEDMRQYFEERRIRTWGRYVLSVHEDRGRVYAQDSSSESDEEQDDSSESVI